jgi:uncharacterized Zn-finger protein
MVHIRQAKTYQELSLRKLILTLSLPNISSSNKNATTSGGTIMNSGIAISEIQPQKENHKNWFCGQRINVDENNFALSVPTQVRPLGDTDGAIPLPLGSI